MTRQRMAFPAIILLFTLSIPAAGQSLFESPDTAVAPRMGAAHQQQQSPADSSVIVVRPELTDEQLADLYMVRKDYREATLVYKRLADQNPHNPVYLNKLGISLHQQAALSMALKYYQRASKADPSYADAQNNIGTIWYQRKKYGKAIKAYHKAIGIRNDMAVLYSNLAYAYFGTRIMNRPSLLSAKRSHWIRSSSSTTVREAGLCCRTGPSVIGDAFISSWQNHLLRQAIWSAA